MGLPDRDGMTFLEEIRKESLTPVIVVSARNEDKDKVDALDLGANDYVTKPFSSAELVARVRSALRNSRHSADEGRFPGGKFESDGLVIDYDARRVFIDKTEINLTQTEYNIIALLSEHSGKVMTYAAIINSIWGYSDVANGRLLKASIATTIASIHT